ncbi:MULTISPECIES: sensor histidine kinase [unclassified Ensifer]|uniref:sensor histidine kinase n=1 Tax=unclassified Ensifer TaxID=2633371 RepID=UPI000812D32F|nr:MULTISPECIES: sensor histidine kinase [unclassified Ensifer]OCP18313.1 histidine kinase [Ensifer sp. LC54]OCP27514.1 histidine kinase [Ensifer sp. LC384]
MRRETSLFSRLVVRVALVLCGGATLLAVAAWYYARAAADDAYDRLLLGAAIQITANMTVDNGTLAVALPTSAFELLGLAERDRIFYRVIGPDMRTLTGYEDLQTDLDLMSARAAPVFLSARYRDVPVRIVVAARALSDPSFSGWSYVVLAQTTEARRALAGELTSRAMILVGIMSLLALAGTVLAIRYSLLPVSALGAALRARDPQALTPVNVDVPRELRPFTASINHFMGRLDERVTLLQRFIADAAHQIRTPLTALSAQVDMLDEDEMDEIGRRHLGRVRKRVGQLARLTNQLLSHAMVIHRSDSVRFKPVDLTDVARKAFRAAIPITVDPDIVISFEAAPQPIVVLGDAVSLREAIANIIDNSLRHGTVSHLAVRVLGSNGRARVEVEDDGPGIPPSEWSNVTARFVTSKTGEGSMGLGFAIAAEVASAHQGAIGFQEKGERGFTVVLDLPEYVEGAR